jgi:hypothetical protein
MIQGDLFTRRKFFRLHQPTPMIFLDLNLTTQNKSLKSNLAILRYCLLPLLAFPTIVSSNHALRQPVSSNDNDIID